MRGKNPIKVPCCSKYLVPLLFAAIIFMLYSNICEAPFTFDDQPHLPLNPHIRLTDLTWKGIHDAAFQSPAEQRPIPNITFALNYYVHQYDVTGYHLVNIVIHIINGILLFFFIRVTLRLSSRLKTPNVSLETRNTKLETGPLPFFKGRSEKHDASGNFIVQCRSIFRSLPIYRRFCFTPNGSLRVSAQKPDESGSYRKDRGTVPQTETLNSTEWLAFAAALIWLVHPLCIQSVTYIVQRMNSMAALFYLLSFLCYIKGRLSERQVAKILFFAGCAVSGIGALASKQIAVTLPFFILLYEWYFLQDLDVGWFRKRMLPLAGVLLFLGLAAVFFLGAHPIDRILAGYTTREFTLSQRVMTEFRVVLLYLSLLFYPNPARLNLDYDFPLSYSLINPPTTLVSLGLIAGLLIVAILFAKKERLLSFCILWFFGNLVLESSVIGLELVFEHRTYLPSMLAVLAAVLLVHRLIRYRWLRIVLLCLTVALFSFWTYERNGLWADEQAFWEDVVRKSPGKARPHYNLGLVMSNRGEMDGAILHYRESLRINPDYSRAHNNLGIALADKGEYDTAMEHLHRALEIDPAYPKAHNNYGIVLARQGNIEEALLHYYRALQIDPSYYEVYINIGVALADLGRYEEAVEQYHRVLEEDPESVEAHVNMGIALTRMGKNDEAIEYLKKALQLKPDNPDAHNNLGVAYNAGGNLDGAIQEYRTALSLNPRHAETHYNLGIAFMKKNRLNEAIKEYREALKIRPDYSDAHNNLGVALIRDGHIDAAVTHLKQAIESKPGSIRARENLQKALDTRMSVDEAIEQLQRQIDEDSENAFLKNRLGDLYQIRGETEKAIKLYERVPEIQPEYAQALNNLAIVYTARGEYERALSLLEKITELQPGNPVPYYNIACIFAKREQAEDAVAWLEKAVEKGFDNWEYLRTDQDLDAIRDAACFIEWENKYK